MIENQNSQSTLDVNKLLTGKDGQLYIELSDHKMVFLSEVDTFSVQMNVTNTDVQPVGSSLTYAVPTSYSVTLTMTEMVIRDDIMLSVLYDQLKKGLFPTFNFQGKIRRRDGKEQRQTFRNCVPDGSIDLMSLTPGEVIKRAWQFRVNALPELHDYFQVK